MSQIIEIPLFPLHTVLFPEGALPLRIFEPRYMDMAKVCLRDGSAFGICLIAEGKEVGQPAKPHPVGTVARIAEWDMPQLGLLEVLVRGEQRFRVIERWVENSGLLRARVELWPNEPRRPVADEYSRLVAVLRRAMAMAGEEPPPADRLDDAAWLSYRFCELLDLAPALCQELLETEECSERLAEIFRICAGKGLLET
ncbi:MAG TPA: LON peptidase substrate-binding domain-containing protein [Rhodocyclaceae bacterium]